MHGRAPGGRETLVDAARDLAGAVLDRTIVLELDARRDADLDEYEPSDPLGMTFEESLETFESFGNSLGVIETIDAEADARVAKPQIRTQLLLREQRVGALGDRRDLIGRHADRGRAHPGAAAGAIDRELL